MFDPTHPRVVALTDAATKLAQSLIGRLSYTHGLICSSCQMGSVGNNEINHVPSCLVGQVLIAARALNAPQEEFFRIEG